MPLIVAVILAGIFIEILGTIISVTGVSTSFGGNLLIIAFVLALDLAKIISISAVYQYWEKLPWKFRLIGPLFIVATMGISSYGAAGYFSNEFEKTMVDTRDTTHQVETLRAQIVKYEERKKEIDSQIANLPEKTSVNQRIRMINVFKEEQKAVNARITEIEAQLPELESANLAKAAEAGPIMAISKALDIAPELAMKIVVGGMIMVFNPFAVYLVYLGNFMLKQRRKDLEAAVKPVVVEAPAAVAPVVEVPVEEPTPKEEMRIVRVTLEEGPAITDPDAVIATAPQVEEVPEVPAEEVPAHVVEVAEGVELKEEITEEVEPVLSAKEVKARQRRVSMLLDKSLDSINDNTQLHATPVVEMQASRSVYK